MVAGQRRRKTRRPSARSDPEASGPDVEDVLSDARAAAVRAVRRSSRATPAVDELAVRCGGARADGRNPRRPVPTTSSGVAAQAAEPAAADPGRGRIRTQLRSSSCAADEPAAGVSYRRCRAAGQPAGRSSSADVQRPPSPTTWTNVISRRRAGDRRTPVHDAAAGADAARRPCARIRRAGISSAVPPSGHASLSQGTRSRQRPRARPADPAAAGLRAVDPSPSPAARERSSPTPPREAASQPRGSLPPAQGRWSCSPTPPGASVTINGKWSGRTPLTHDALRVRRLRRARRRCRGMQAGTTGQPLSDAASRTLSMQLQRDAGAASRSATPLAATSAPETVAGAGAARASARACRIDARRPASSTSTRARSGAKVFVDGKAGRHDAAADPDVAPRRARRPPRAHGAPHLDDVAQVARGRDHSGYRIAGTDSMKATLALENGIWYEGEAAGAPGETGGEVVFNTSMTGYQEVLTDPVVRRTDRHDDGAGDRQLRHRRPRTASRAARRSPASSSARSRRSRATGAPTARCATTSSATTSSRSRTSIRAR